MAYHPTYSYTYSSSSGWDYGVQAGSSTGSCFWEGGYLFGGPIHPDPQAIPITRYSTLAGALASVDPTQQGGEAQQVQHQPAQLANPQLVALPPAGVQTQPTAGNKRRAAYVLVSAPTRHRRQPAGTIKFCRVSGCGYWTAEPGKKLNRHRASHFPKQVGVKCPHCSRFFLRSGRCGEHLKRCSPPLWMERAATKGTQDSWGERIGQDLIAKSLVEGVYTPRVEYEL